MAMVTERYRWLSKMELTGVSYSLAIGLKRRAVAATTLGVGLEPWRGDGASSMSSIR